mmetsp:Transcript_25274/g.66248  ORF Transcript_25274/g.66248 Transcript_25274/m.66248 type:complete len:293 (+) Transcript_25274:240-1118(+)
MPCAGSNLDPSSESFLWALAYSWKKYCSSAANLSKWGLKPGSVVRHKSVGSQTRSGSFSADTLKYSLSKTNHFLHHDWPPLIPTPGFPSARTTVPWLVYFVGFEYPKGQAPLRSLKTRPTVCAPERATISRSEKPIFFVKTFRKCSAGVAEPQLNGGWASGSPAWTAKPSREEEPAHCSGPAAETRPYFIGITGPPITSTAVAEAIWIKSAQDTVGYFSLNFVRYVLDLVKPAFAPKLISGSNLMLPMAPPHSGQVLMRWSKVPESCHAKRIRMGPQFASEMKSASSARNLR